MVQRTLSLLAVSLWVTAAPAWTQVSGQVASPEGVPIENARVEAGERVTFTDFEGSFELAGVTPPVTITVSHPRFAAASVEVAGRAPQRVQLEPKFFQEIAVSANRDDAPYAPSSVAASVVSVEELAAPPATLTELVAAVPGVSENGQGGIFQTYSIRGIARLRVLTLLSGMRVIGERRAGVSASFLDPGLIGDVDVLRGPSSSYYGSGALGGVVQMFPREFSRAVGELAFESNGDGRRLLAGWGDERWSLGVAHRRSDEGEAPDGATLNDGYEQSSATVLRRWERGARRFSLLAVASRGNDIGKSNSDFPDRVTVYPTEEHWMLRFGVGGSGWELEAWVHPNELETEVVRDGLSITTRNEAFDFGFDWHRRSGWGDQGTVRYGIEAFGRRGVEARELLRPVDGVGPRIEQTPLDGSEDELGLYGALERRFGATVVLAGGRLAVQEQQAAGRASEQETATALFVGLVTPVASGLELTANLGSGLRFPSLSERYFTGVTPRGSVAGNPDLDSERSWTLDAGLRYYGSRLFVAAGAFVNEIDDYIERIEPVEDQLSFVNLTSGRIEGVELEGAYTVGTDWTLGWGGHRMEGRADDGSPLADVPADQLNASARWRRGAWSGDVRWEHRFDKDDPGSGESAIAGADLVSAGFGIRFDNGWSLQLAGRNLADESYFTSADDKAALSRGRSVSLTLAWSG